MQLFLLQITNDTLIENPINSDYSTNIWIWISIIEFIIILSLLYRSQSRSSVEIASKSNDLKEAKFQDVDMDNLINSIAKSKDLYKELSKKCHPDRFSNSPKQDVANQIFQEITKNKRNYNKLLELKAKAIQELNIHFND